MKLKHICVYGRVQGVGFRFYTEKIAKALDIEGTVENVEDFVEIYAQGPETQLNNFIERIVKGPSPMSKVDTYTIDELPPDESIKGFWTK
ncbi:acylphosphatase [Staphylococcus massiliensis]|uniref:acylphosphatase n=1 Tax=Staphylococcus massiliensis S46 TaxID=1229783 RepID=K9B006_9STAP|nr:acylphosphatase [Staphylococcus massiliensis]EKU47120.1 acylphosphatase [Staphylococcus massiliensis S46]MCG3398588.1 acylphosphatase [Staphylococcus massiliensis]MCG3401153.1 acylphosphatase [Staphylococcus massiliensis]MCG3412289.1 acylphosphatase [Staphylococcus massiliensis]PNZ99268.1 acylphosphatase [Staphylococcus massiliensis CCUG 55927]